jgi:ABC-type branched-subunit amino acid transport system ATPase component
MILRVKGLSKCFGGLQAVTSCSFELEEGRVTGLIGPNGAGKTTIFNLITGFLKPEEGEVIFREKPVIGLAPHEIVRLGISRTFQDLRIFKKLTVKENILVGNQRMVGESIFDIFFRNSLMKREMKTYEKHTEEIMEFVKLSDKSEEIAENLSYAEWKLLSLARTLSTEPDLILLDEPGSGLDPRSLAEMLMLIHQLRDQGKTVLIIEHNLDVIRETADHVCFLSTGGVIAKQGKFEEILKNQELVDEYLGAGR